MKTRFLFSQGPLRPAAVEPDDDACGAMVTFAGTVRRLEQDKAIDGLFYEAHVPMALRELERIASELTLKHPVRTLVMEHSLGFVPTGDVSLLVRVEAPHRGKALSCCKEFIDRLKAEVPIFKSVAAAPVASRDGLESLDTLHALLHRHLRRLPVMELSLEDAAGLTLAETLACPEDAPAFDRSAMDGFALAESDVSESFLINGEVRAGAPAPAGIKPGTCWRVGTGAALPPGTGRVIPFELVEEKDNRIVPRSIPAVSHVRRRGSSLRQGAPLAEAGALLDAGTLTLLASFGITRAPVFARPRVAHVVTGSELVASGEAPGAGQIRDTNSLLVRQTLREHGFGDPLQIRLTEDPEALKAHWDRLDPKPDLLLISGGAGPGKHDHSRQVLEALGFTVHLHGIRLKPGKPLVFATLGEKAAMALPGNPMSHFALLHLAVLPALRLLSRGAFDWNTVEASLAGAFELPAGDGRPAWWPARLTHLQDWNIELLPWQDSGDLAPLARCNALASLDGSAKAFPAGTRLRALPLFPLPV